MRTGRDFTSIYETLRERVALMDYAPGSLLSENRLAQEFGVSRTPIRTVLQRLEFDGLVSVVRGVGTVVAPIDTMYLKQVYALRLKLLDVIAELGVKPAAVDEVRELKELHAAVLAMEEPGARREFARAYLRFDAAVTRAIGNEPLREIADRLFYLTARVWLQALAALDWHEEVRIAADEIGDVCEALERGDMPALAGIRRRHLIDCIHRVNDYLGDFEVLPRPT